MVVDDGAAGTPGEGTVDVCVMVGSGAMFDVSQSDLHVRRQVGLLSSNQRS